jgi:two-component system, OmpR family, copper resistance phosphate regulon response regulator CusR
LLVTLPVPELFYCKDYFSVMERILIVEDEIKTALSLKKGLEENNYEVDYAINGQEALKLAATNTYSLIISDIVMPVINGIEICQALRKSEVTCPILMLTALGSIDDKVSGFNAGADDYLVKPFEFRELLARVKALLKRQPFQLLPKAAFADMELDAATKSVLREGMVIPLTSREFSLMEYFFKNPGRIISKTEIAEKVWSINFDTGTNVIEVYVNYLRNKIDKPFKRKFIHTVHGHGYILKQEE